MNEREEKRAAALQRRHDHLSERLEKWDRGDSSRTKAERAALHWALCVIAAADDEGTLTDLARDGRRLLNGSE